MANASRDESSVPTLLGVSTTDGKTPIKIYADPDTHRLLVETTSGGVVGPGSSTANAAVRWSGTAGEAVLDSIVIISDLGNVTGVNDLTADGNVDADTYSVGGTPGASGTFTTVDLKTVTVVNGIITDISP